MNIKERLNSLKEQKSSSISIKEDINVSQFFKRIDFVESFIVKAFNNNKNFILLCDKNCDKEIVCNYISKFINHREKIEIIQNTIDDLKYSIASKVIAIEPNIKDIINLLKLSINDFKTFVFTINAKQYENILNSLSTLLLIELPNLKCENVDYLIGASEAIILFFTTDEDGLLYVKNIGEITYKKNELSLSTIYSQNDSIEKNDIEEKTIEEENIATTEEIVIEATNKTDIIVEAEQKNEEEAIEEVAKEITKVVNDTEVKNVSEEKTTTEVGTIEEKTKENKLKKIKKAKKEEDKKINKYKLLKEKAKRKRVVSE